MKFLPRKDVLISQLKISGFPLALAAGYAVIGFLTIDPEKRSFTTLINYFAAGFFFLMWLVGQYLRTAKQLDDSSNYEAIQAGLSDVQESIRKLHEFQSQKTERATSSNSLLDSAKRAVEDGHVIAGLMQAGVAFEQAVITKANQLRLYRGPRVPVAKTISGFRRVMDDSVIDELFAVWKLRNQLVHMSPEAADELAQRPELIDYFEWAISELEQLPSNQ